MLNVHTIGNTKETANTTPAAQDAEPTLKSRKRTMPQMRLGHLVCDWCTGRPQLGLRWFLRNGAKTMECEEMQINGFGEGYFFGVIGSLLIATNILVGLVYTLIVVVVILNTGCED